MKRTVTLVFSLLLTGMGTILKSQDQSGFYDVDKIQQLAITFEQDNWRYLLDSLRFNGDGMLIGSLEVNGEKFEDVGIRYRGSRSFQPGGRRNGLTVKLNFIKKSQNYQGHSIINLSSALRDPSMIREVLSYEIARNYMPAPRANYAKVKINGEQYGLFVNVEPVESTFLTRYFGTENGSFFRSNPNFESKAPQGCKTDVHGSLVHDNGAKCYLQNFEILSGSGWDDLMELTRVLSSEPDKLDKVLNVDRTLWMHAFNNVLVNLSSYSGQYSPNYYLYQDTKGQFNPVIWDLNLSFASFKNTGEGSDLNLKALQELDPLLHAENPARPLISVLLKNEMHRKVYLSHVRTILYEQFVSGNYEKRAKALQELIRKALEEDKNWYYDMKEFAGSLTETTGERSRIPGIISFMEARADFLRKHPALTILPPEVSGIAVERRERLSSQHVTDFKITANVGKFARRVRILYRFRENEEFKEGIMMDDGKHFDGEAGDEVYGIQIKPPAGVDAIEYYIVAENARAVSFDPSTYMFNRHSASLMELNK
jgi:hypothetical protein